MEIKAFLKEDGVKQSLFLFDVNYKSSEDGWRWGVEGNGGGGGGGSQSTGEVKSQLITISVMGTK